MRTVLTFLITLTGILMIEGQAGLQYQLPHDDILELADASPAPLLRMNAKATHGVLLYRSNYKSIDELSETEMRLAGLRINPRTNISSRTRYYDGVTFFDIESGKETPISGLPKNVRLSGLSWNHAQDKVAILNTVMDGVEAWIVDLQTKQAKKITDANINANIGTPIRWMKDDKNLLVSLLPKDRKALIDRSKSVPAGPTISSNDGQKAQNRTYQDLLKNPTDEENFVQLVRAELWKVGIDGQKSLWKEADLYSSVSFSPNGEYVMITTLNKPFSYLVPYSRFPQKKVMYDKDGKHVKDIQDLPLIEELPKGFMSVRTQPRAYQWRGDKPATLVWAEALDGGDPEQEVDYRDAVYQLQAPFNGRSERIAKTKLRFSGITWGDGDLAVMYDYWWNTRMLRTSFISPDDQKEPRLFSERNYQDVYANPGSFVVNRNEFGNYTLVNNDETLYLLGDGYSDEGKKPFVDEYDLKSGETKRLYESNMGEKLEDLASGIDMKKGILLTRIESKTEYPNYYFRNIKTGELNPITQFKNPFEAIQNVEKEVITYQREDGLELTGTLYLPVGYDKQKKAKMPMILWAYPREYKDKSSASQTTSSPYEFTYPFWGSPIYWVNRGYVVLDDAAFPIIGEGEEQPNDSFIKQLVANAKAAIDAVDELGYIDRSKVAVGGHSYGAFMTANLLTHSDLFAAGIARSGAYNRTLTPFGFQSEERNYWEAPDVYNTMSPFMNAHKMKTPLLLIHGEADNNSGTYPMQSERYFNALKGLGATVRLVMLPKESHGYSAKESIMHMLWEQDQWLEKYVKNSTQP